MFSGFIWPCLFHLTQCVLDALTDTPQTTAIYSESLWCIQRVSRPASFFFQPQPLFSLTMAPLTTAHDRCTTARVRAQKCRLRIGKTTQHQHWRGRSGTTVKDPDNEETVDMHSHKPSDAAFSRGCVSASVPSWTKPKLQQPAQRKHGAGSAARPHRASLRDARYKQACLLPLLIVKRAHPQQPPAHP